MDDSKKPLIATPQVAAMEIAADWDRECVVFTQKSQAGIQLVNPITFMMPFDAFLGVAFNLASQKLEKEAKAKAARLVGSPSISFKKGPREM